MAITLTKLSNNISRLTGNRYNDTTGFANDHVSVHSRLKSEKHFKLNTSSLASLLYIVDICGKNNKTL